jgi:hypothetical protein
VPPKPLWRRAVPAVLSAILAAGLTSVAALYRRSSPVPPVVTRFSLMVLDGQPLVPQTTQRAVTVSPDGTLIAFTTTGQLYLRSLSELEARPIASADAAGPRSAPSFHPTAGPWCSGPTGY